MPVTAVTGQLVLRPGLPVVRRDARTLQVGLHPPLAVRLPDAPEVRGLLASLRSGAVPADLAPLAAHALEALRAADVVVPAGPEPASADALVLQAEFGADGVRRRAQRATQRIGVRAEGASRAVLDELLELVGLAVDDAGSVAWLVVAAGPVSREEIDPLARVGAPYLVVSGDTPGRRVGPFVEPGRTACLRCVDAHEAEADPRRPFLVEQAARASDGEEPVDPVLDRLALAWAVRDLCRYVEGDEPSTWSATVDLPPSGAPVLRRWLRHPHCGCAWDLLLDLP